jgi:hypothetical protein
MEKYPPADIPLLSDADRVPEGGRGLAYFHGRVSGHRLIFPGNGRLIASHCPSRFIDFSPALTLMTIEAGKAFASLCGLLCCGETDAFLVDLSAAFGQWRRRYQTPSTAILCVSCYGKSPATSLAVSPVAV